ncbi:hypothetical protein [Flavobacterium luteolum]|uniref:hypothetical protein n=1 Tax=Flavobacterium luteolum TaxID=3003259 RepID=UPI00248E2458|nr:hypothetical protein [Flavobacterium luteolum]
MKEKQVCYNCGNLIEEKEITKEHIPAKNLFEGYDDKYKTNRITVYACLKCNNEYSPTDEDFRNMIGAIAKRKENNQIANKAKRSLLRKDPEKESFSLDKFGKISGITLNEITIEDYHKKNFKGLFNFQYGKVFDDNEYDIYVNIDEDDWTTPTMGILGYLKELFNRQVSGHEDILNYTVQPFRLGITNPEKQDLVPEENENIYVGYFDYVKEHASLVIAVRKKYLEEIKKRRSGSA